MIPTPVRSPCVLVWRRALNRLSHLNSERGVAEMESNKVTVRYLQRSPNQERLLPPSHHSAQDGPSVSAQPSKKQNKDELSQPCAWRRMQIHKRVVSSVVPPRSFLGAPVSTEVHRNTRKRALSRRTSRASSQRRSILSTRERDLATKSKERRVPPHLPPALLF